MRCSASKCVVLFGGHVRRETSDYYHGLLDTPAHLEHQIGHPGLDSVNLRVFGLKPVFRSRLGPGNLVQGG